MTGSSTEVRDWRASSMSSSSLLAISDSIWDRVPVLHRHGSCLRPFLGNVLQFEEHVGKGFSVFDCLRAF